MENKIEKSYHYYFIVISIDEFSIDLFFKGELKEFFFNELECFPEQYQNMCTPLMHGDGLMFDGLVVDSIKKNVLFEEFKSCFVFNIPHEICDFLGQRFTKSYSVEFDIDNLLVPIPMQEILNFESSPWAKLLTIDADYFYLKDAKRIFIAAKDHNFINQFAINI